VTRDRVAVVDRTRLIGSARVRDGFYSTFVVRRLSRRVTAVALRLGLRPNEVTVVSLLIALVAAALFTRGQVVPTVVAAVLLQVSLVVDCVDGEVARYTGRFTPVGAWLDGVGDRVKEYCVYAGLAAGYHAWSAAAALLVIQVFRHHVDFGFAATRAGATSSADNPVTALSARTNERPALMWAKRVLIMPIGERWLLLSVVSALAGGEAALLTLVVTCSVAALYTTAGRLLRALTTRSSSLDPDQLAAMTALLPPPAAGLPAALTRARPAGIVPALIRAGELAALLAVAAHEHLLPVAFALATVIALDGYDLVYRLRQTGELPARWRRVAGLGALPRLAVVLAVMLVAGTGAHRALAVLATAFALLCVVEVSAWLRSAGSTP
jgi:phosphatidylglycerophosphate synthase